MYTEKDWPFKTKPRLVQLEALSRSLFNVSGYTPDGARPEPVPIKSMHEAPNRGWGHYLEMRLGKTQATLAEFVFLAKFYDVTRFLVLAPSKFTEDWDIAAKAVNFPYPHRAVRSKVLTAKGDKALPDSGLLVCNHEIIHNKKHCATLIRWVKGGKTITVIDESVILANFTSPSSQAMHSIGKESAFTRTLSGKPQVKGPSDMYGQIRFTKGLNGVLSNDFNARYCKFGGFQGRQIVDVRADNLDELNATINSIGFVAKKLDWANIGDPDTFDRRIPMHPAQVEAYRKMEKDYYLEFDGAEVSPEQIVTAHAKLNQISCGFVFDDERECHWLVPPETLPRFKEIKVMLEEEIPKHEKVIIVAVHAPVIAALLDYLKDYNPAVIRGMQKPAFTVEEKNRFNTDPNCRVIIGQCKATKYGHDLRGTRENPCLTTIMMEGTFSLDDYSQVIERNRGVDQYGQTQVVHFVSTARDTAMINSVAKKDDWASSVVYDRELFKPSELYT